MLEVKTFQTPQPYAPILTEMQAWIEARKNDKKAPDELWLLQHQPIFTLGQAGDIKHVLNPGKIPVLRCDRGGQVTYHGPGQLMIYTLLNLERLQLNTRSLVRRLEQWIIDYLGSLNVSANNDINAPGVYTDGKKICSIGLRITKNLSYHGLAFNIDMDLSPFDRINPCGFAKLAMTDLNQHVSRSMSQVMAELIPLFAKAFDYDNWHITTIARTP